MMSNTSKGSQAEKKTQCPLNGLKWSFTSSLSERCIVPRSKLRLAKMIGKAQECSLCLIEYITVVINQYQILKCNVCLDQASSFPWWELPYCICWDEHSNLPKYLERQKTSCWDTQLVFQFETSSIRSATARLCIILIAVILHPVM